MFSSDISKDSLIYSDNTGKISIINLFDNQERKIITDPSKKDVKYYPTDSFVFTTTDFNGLKVWDSYKESCIYSYKRDNLYLHSYSSQMILASFDDYNIKIFDLKCRYMIQSFSLSNIKTIGWANNLIVAFDGESIYEVDLRDTSKILKRINKIVDFTAFNETYFGLTFDKRLFKMNGPSKLVKYSKILGIKGTESLACLLENQIIIEENDRIWKYTNSEKIIKMHGMYMTQKRDYLFVNDDLLIVKKV